MKKLLFSFVLFSAAFYAADAFAKAECPIDMTQTECCESRGTYTLSDAQSICGAGSYTTEGVYYAGCYTCSSSSSTTKVCPIGCLTCSGVRCKTCESGFYKSGNTCKLCSTISVSNGKCTACSSAGTCTAVSCNSGYTANGTTCEKTVTCSGRTPEALTQNDGSTKCSCTATSCGTGAKCIKHPAYNSKTKLNNYSVCVCQSGYYDNGESCSACGGGCSECSGPNSCTACEDGYTLQDGECVAACDRYDVGNGTCTECDSYGCTDAECNGSNGFFNPIFRKCGVECDVNQYLDASYTCQDCPAGQTSTGGWLTTPTNCYSCDSIPVDGGTCTECQDGVCTKARCENGYVLDASGRACIAARATCSSPLKISDDGCCCVK